MKDKGFTLIELLAVIVILAIIALIATPIILNIINNSKDESNKRSVEMYADAIKNSIAKHQLDGSTLVTGTFTTTNGKKLFQNDKEKLIVDYDGNVVCKIIEIYEDGNIYLNKCEVNNKEVEYKYGWDQTFDNGQITYFDVVNGVGCTKREYEKSWDDETKDYLNSKMGYNGYTNKDEFNNEIEKIDKQNSCLKFYAFNDDGGNTINLILDHNTTALVAWTDSTTETTAEGPIDVTNQLKEDTNEWNLPIISKNYEYKGTNSYPINYNTKEYKARLITAQEIAQITGADKEDTLNWKEESSINWFCFDGSNGDDINWQTQVVGSNYKIKESKYYWLFDRTNNCVKYGCRVEDSATYGYWTSSAYAKVLTHSWHIINYGYINFYHITNPTHYGVRPVIEVPKSNL